MSRSGKDKEGPKELARMLVEEPSSARWLVKWARHLEETDAEKARAFLEKKLAACRPGSTADEERLWIECLRLSKEDEGSFQRVLAEALGACSEKRLCMKAARMLGSGQGGQEEALCARLEKASKKDSEVRVFLLQREADTERGIEGARKMFKECSGGFGAEGQLRLCKAMASLEYEKSSAEHGRTFVEAALGRWKKKLELWFFYLELELKHGDVDAIRRLFSRILALRLSSKKSKNILKKYMAFERERGDDEGAENVRRLAKEHSARFQ